MRGRISTTAADIASSAPGSPKHTPVRDATPHRRRCRHILPAQAQAHPLALDRSPRDDRAGPIRIVQRADRADPRPAQPLANPRPGTGQILKLEPRVNAWQIGAAPYHRGRRLVRLRSRFRKPGARRHRDRDRDALGERRGDRRFHAADQVLWIVARTEPRRELVDRMDRGNGQNPFDCGDHATVDVNVTLNALRTHDESRAERASIADPIARSNACALRHGVDSDERRVRVRIARDDADGTPVERRVRGLLAGGEKSISVQVEPPSSHVGTGEYPHERLSIRRRPKTPVQSQWSPAQRTKWNCSMSPGLATCSALAAMLALSGCAGIEAAREQATTRKRIPPQATDGVVEVDTGIDALHTRSAQGGGDRRRRREPSKRSPAKFP